MLRRLLLKIEGKGQYGLYRDAANLPGRSQGGVANSQNGSRTLFLHQADYIRGTQYQFE